MVSRLSQIQGCLLGLALGDTLGMPVEIMTPEEILHVTEGKGVVGFNDPLQPLVDGVKWFDGFIAGDTTDDTQLALAIVRALLHKGEYDIDAIAREHVIEIHENHRGWGASTKSGVRAVGQWLKTNGHLGRDPRIPAPVTRKGQGLGNGVAMKIAPLAIWHNLREADMETRRKQIFQLGQMTHGDLRASITAAAIGFVIDAVLRNPFDPSLRPRQNERLHFLQPLHDNCVVPLDQYSEAEGDQSFAYIMSRLWEIVQSEDSFTHDIVRTTFGTSCFCLHSVPFSIATFLRHPTDFRTGVLEAVNAGGDTDTNGAMVGAMIGANVGLEGIPEEWRTFRPEFEKIVELGERFYMEGLTY